MCSPVSDPAKPDSDYDELLDTEDPKPLSTINNGIPIELNKEEIEMLQKWLVNLGYLDMYGNPYGQSYGILTETAVNVYQLNHGFELTEKIDSNTFATIANEYMLKLEDGKIQYNNISIINKPFFKYIPIIKPLLSDKYVESNVKIVFPDNSTFKSDYDHNGNPVQITSMYLFDYTNPINEMINKNAEECFKRSASDLSTYWWFFWIVNNEEDWDIKLKNRWDEQLPSINQYSKHFPFKFRDQIITAEDLGNITYGYWGTCVGFEFEVLLFGGDFASGGTDSEEDKTNIRIGNFYYCVDFNDYTKLFVY